LSNPDNERVPLAVYVEFIVNEGGVKKTYRRVWEGLDYYEQMRVNTSGAAQWVEVPNSRVKLLRNPIVHCFNEEPDNDSGYWICPPGLQMAAFTVNKMNQFYNPLGNLVLMQTFSTLNVFGQKPDGDKLAIGPNKVNFWPADSAESQTRVEYLTPQANIADWLDWLRHLDEEEAAMHSIPKSLLDVLSSGITSGIAIQEARAPLLELRRQRMKLFAPVERELVRSIVAVLQQAGKLKNAGDPNLWDCHVAHREVAADDPEETKDAPDGREVDGAMDDSPDGAASAT
jgi:hypothetical protein